MAPEPASAPKEGLSLAAKILILIVGAALMGFGIAQILGDGGESLAPYEGFN